MSEPTVTEPTVAESFADVNPDIDMSKLIIPDEEPAAEPKTEKTPVAKETETPDDTPADEVTGEGEGKADASGATDNITIGDVTYSKDQIAEAVKAMNDRDNWQKTNTQKAQDVAALHKAISPVVETLKGITGNQEVRDEIRAVIADILGDEQAKQFDEAIKYDPNKQVDDPLAEQLTAKTKEYDDYKAQVEGEKIVQAEAKELRHKYRLSDKQSDEVVAFADKRFQETGSVLTLDEAYRIMHYDEVKAKADEKKSPKPPEPPVKGAAAQTIKKQAGAAKSFGDIDVSGINFFEDDTGG